MVRVIIELSGNHGGKLDNCVKLIREAKKLKPASIKFQCFEADKLAEKRLPDPVVATALGMENASDTAKAMTYLALYCQIWTPKQWWGAILEELGGYPWSCSVFSVDDLKFLEERGCPAYKIASFELADLNLIRACAATGKPLTMSVNYSATEEDVRRAYVAAVGAERITMLHASRYRDNFDDHLSHLKLEMERFLWLCEKVPLGIDVGLSDHSPQGSYELSRLAVEKDADMFERHMCLGSVKTPDSNFSSTPREMAKYISKLKAHAKTRNKSEAQAAPRRSR